MRTYSDALHPIRIFLEQHNPQRLEKREQPDGIIIERWLIQGSEIIFRIQVNGEWDVFVPVSQEKDPKFRITALERFLQGQRQDLDLIADMANLCNKFLDKLAEFPACSGEDCDQSTCAENRAMRKAIENFKTRLFSPPIKDSDHAGN